MMQPSYSYSSVLFVCARVHASSPHCTGSAWVLISARSIFPTPRWLLTFPSAASYDSTSPFFNTLLAAPVTLSLPNLPTPYSPPLVANPLPGLIEEDSSSTGSHTGVALKWRAQGTGVTRLPILISLPIHIYIYSQPLLLCEPLFHFSLFSSSSSQGSELQPGARSSLQIVREKPRRRNGRLSASSSLWLRMWVRQQYVLTLS